MARTRSRLGRFRVDTSRNKENVPDNEKQPADWPSEDFQFCKEQCGWYASENSDNWLFKPSSKVYFHTPTETLWKRAAVECTGKSQPPQKYIRVDATALCASSDMALATLAGVAGITGGVWLKDCFAAWRFSMVNFDAMDLDLQRECCEIVCMPTRPRASARACTKDTIATMDTKAIATVEEVGGTDHFATLLGWLRSSGSGIFAQHEQDSLKDVQLMELTPGALVLHNRRMPRSSSGGSPLSQTFTCSVGFADNGQVPDGISKVHRERQEQWQSHSEGDRLDVIDDAIGLEMGVEVVFEGGDRLGVVAEAYPQQDRYILKADGKVVTDAKGKPRNFTWDELSSSTAVFMLPEIPGLD